MANPKLSIQIRNASDQNQRGKGGDIEWYKLILYANQTSDLVAPPTMNTKIRCPTFLKSLDACLSTESLWHQKNIKFTHEKVTSWLTISTETGISQLIIYNNSKLKQVSTQLRSEGNNRPESQSKKKLISLDYWVLMRKEN